MITLLLSFMMGIVFDVGVYRFNSIPGLYATGLLKIDCSLKCSKGCLFEGQPFAINPALFWLLTN
jgi:hypothetical protein